VRVQIYKNSSDSRDADLRMKLFSSFEYVDIIMDNGYLRTELKEKFTRGIDSRDASDAALGSARICFVCVCVCVCVCVRVRAYGPQG